MTEQTFDLGTWLHPVCNTTTERYKDKLADYYSDSVLRPSLQTMKSMTPHTYIILSDNYRLLLPVGSFTVLMKTSQASAHLHGGLE